MLKISYAASPCLSQLILAQFSPAISPGAAAPLESSCN